MRFDHLSLDEGLSQTSVLAITQDSTGFLWFGTENGLNRFDGYHFEHFKRDAANPRALTSDWISDMAQDARGHIWLATTDGGLAEWNPETERFHSYREDASDPDSLSTNALNAVQIGDDGHIWIATRNSGLDRLDPATGKVTHFRHDPADPQSLGSDEIFALHMSAARQLWIGTEGGLNRLDTGTGRMTRFMHDPDDPRSLSSDRIRAVYQDSRGTIWIGTYKSGLNRFDLRRGEFDRFSHHPEDAHSLSHDRVSTIFEDRDGRLWVGTAHGLNLFDHSANNFVRYVHDPANPSSLSDDYVMAMYQDRGGVLWVGTRSGGLNKWNPRSWSFGHHSSDPGNPKGLSDPNISSFAEDGEGRLWVGTFRGGLHLMDRTTGETTHYRHDPEDGASLSNDRVMALLYDSTGMLWIGTMSGGLNRLDPTTGEFRTYRHDPQDPSSIGADGVMSLFEDSEGELWIGTFGGGVGLLDRSTDAFTRFTHDPDDPTTLSSHRATSFTEDSNGMLWIGTDSGGVSLLDRRTGRFHQFRHDPGDVTSLSADTVFSLFTDRHGSVWVGTSGGGLDRVRGSSLEPETLRFQNHSQADGLANDVIYAILPDSADRLWLATNYGLSRYNPATGRTRNFHRSHGLQGEEFNFGAHYASPRGELFFGGSNGFNAFFPNQLSFNDEPPPVVLTSFSKFNRPVETEVAYSYLRDIPLGYRDDVVTFEFAALDFTAPEENRYAYMLEGFDDEWVEAGNLRRVTYTNLDKGQYEFKLRAANSDGVWNHAGLEIGLQVQPAPWETWWAYLGYVLTGLLMIAGVWGAQQRKLAREADYSRRLEGEVRERTQELADRNDELHTANHKLLEASITDPLTGLRNRRFLFDEVSRDIDVIRRRHRDAEDGVAREAFDLVFMMIDLDHFKPINDTCGHAAGDKMLLQVRDVLLASCRSSDFVIRWGGDEFLVISRYTDASEAETLAERIRSGTEQKIFDLGESGEGRTTCSIGFACYPFVHSEPDQLTWEQVLGLADAAMYEAKEQRDAWVGYLPTDKARNEPYLLRASLHDTERLQSDRLITATRSIEKLERVCA